MVAGLAVLAVFLTYTGLPVTMYTEYAEETELPA